MSDARDLSNDCPNQSFNEPDDFFESPGALSSLTLEDGDDQHHHFGEETVWRSVAFEDNYSHEDEVDSYASPDHQVQRAKDLYLGDHMLPFEGGGRQPGRPKMELKKPNLVELTASVNPAPLVLSSEPAWVEPWSSFLSSSVPEELLSRVRTILSAHEHLDHEEAPNQASLKGLVSAPDGTTVNFQLSLFSRPGSNTIVAEVQRRRGCIVAFGAFYRSLIKQLGPQHVKCQLADEDAIAADPYSVLGVDHATLDFSTCSAFGSRLPAFDLSPISSEAVKDICDMASSHENDISSEGMHALAAVSHHKCNLTVLSEHAKPIMELLSSTLTSGGNSSRAAASLVANLARSPNEGIQALLTSTLLSKLLETLDEPASLENKRTKRQVARALASLGCTTHNTHIAVHRAKLEEHMQASDDPRLHEILADTLQSCEKHCS